MRYEGRKQDDRHATHQRARGQGLPQQYFGDQDVVSGVSSGPARDAGDGYRWAHDKDGNYYLRTAIATDLTAGDPG